MKKNIEKQVEGLTSNLLLILSAYAATIIFNLQLFTTGSWIHILYGIVLCGLFALTLYSLVLIKKGKFETSAKISTIIGPIMAIMTLVEGFTDLELRFIQNIPFTGWI